MGDMAGMAAATTTKPTTAACARATQKGREDAKDGDRYDPRRHNWYRDGDRGYNNRYGSREQYKAAYRDAFERGYAQGYREYGPRA